MMYCLFTANENETATVADPQNPSVETAEDVEGNQGEKSEWSMWLSPAKNQALPAETEFLEHYWIKGSWKE